jgi:hypothetical protein
VTAEYKQAVQDFTAADQTYKALEEYFLGGNFIPDLLTQSRGDAAVMQREFLALVERLKIALEDRNVKLTLAKNALRETVTIPENEWRGADAKAETHVEGPFTVSSTTHRGFDAETLIKGVSKHGLLERLMSLTGYDQKTGKEFKLVEQEWRVDYEGVKNWLQQNKLQDVLTSAYDEKEKTPRVAGPKPLAFLGEKSKDKE